jgi:hypothetical protein
MKTVVNLAVVVALAAVYALLQWLLGDSLLAKFGYFLAVFAVLMLAFGVKRWSRLILSAAGATAIYAIYQSLFPADSVWKILLLVLLTAAIVVPTGRSIMKERRLS